MMTHAKHMEIIVAHMYVSQFRRVIAATLQAAMGFALVYLAAARPPSSGANQIVILGMGLLLLYAALRFWQATAHGLVLTDTVLRETSGRVICQIDQVRKVTRGNFALKPANGFMLYMTTKQTTVWSPGLWWSIGRMVGVGGATNPNAAKQLAEAIEVLNGPMRDQLLDAVRADQPT